MTYLDTPCNRYVYLHTRKDNGAIFYVGKGCGKRIFDEKSRNHLWKSVVKDAGGFNFVKMIDGLTDDEAYCFEEIVVSELREKINLCNLVAGGKGGKSPSVETRMKQRAAKLGKRLSEDHRRKISQSGVGRTSKGWKLSPEVIARRSASMIGRIVSEDTGRKISEAKLGHVQTEETKLKISQKKRGVPWTDARRNAQNKKGLVDGLVS